MTAHPCLEGFSLWLRVLVDVLSSSTVTFPLSKHGKFIPPSDPLPQSSKRRQFAEAGQHNACYTETWRTTPPGTFIPCLLQTRDSSSHSSRRLKGPDCLPYSAYPAEFVELRETQEIALLNCPSRRSLLYPNVKATAKCVDPARLVHVQPLIRQKGAQINCRKTIDTPQPFPSCSPHATDETWDFATALRQATATCGRSTETGGDHNHRAPPIRAGCERWLDSLATRRQVVVVVPPRIDASRWPSARKSGLIGNMDCFFLLFQCSCCSTSPALSFSAFPSLRPSYPTYTT